MKRILFLICFPILIAPSRSAEAAEFLPLGFNTSTDLVREFLAVSEDGSVVMGESGEQFGDLVRWTQSRGHELLIEGGVWSANMSRDGSTIVGARCITGDCFNATFEEGREDLEPFKLTDNGLEVLAVSPEIEDFTPRQVSLDGRTILGTARSVVHDAQIVVRWPDETVHELPLEGTLPVLNGGTSSDAEVFVGTLTAPFDRNAFRWTEDTGFIQLEGFGRNEERTRGLGVSSDGRWTVGRSEQVEQSGLRRTAYQGTR